MSLDLDAIEARANSTLEEPCSEQHKIFAECLSCKSDVLQSLRTDVPALIARVRELEMSDIVTRLRYADSQPPSDVLDTALYGEAADEIERLQAENAALKQRLVIDDAMVERACEVFPKWPGLTLMYAALEAALNGGE